MLSGGTPHTDTPLYNAVNLTVSLVNTALLVVALYKTERCLVRQGTNSSRAEGLSFSEDNLRVIVSLTLVLTGEV